MWPGKAKVLPGTGSNATAEAVRLTRFAAKASARRLALLVAPGCYYNRPMQEGLYAHFAKIAESVDLPLVLYNIPARTGRNVEPETIERLSRLGPIVAVKEASGSLDQVSDLICRTELTILSGDDSLTLPMLAVGAEGVISVVGNLIPREMMAPGDGLSPRRPAEARRLHPKLFPLCRDLLGLAANPIPVKTARSSCWAAATASSAFPSARPTNAHAKPYAAVAGAVWADVGGCIGYRILEISRASTGFTLWHAMCA